MSSDQAAQQENVPVQAAWVSSRHWSGFPLSYLADHTGTAHDRFNDRMSADVGYAHLWVDDSRINRTELTTGAHHPHSGRQL